MIDKKLLKNEELIVYSLRALYRRYGYSAYKMSKFEEYDLYVRNKDFLSCDRMITFTDTSGKLLALKPDVTLSIMNHMGDVDSVQKLYYNENVYRVAGDSRNFKEIVQTGLECVGNIGLYEICEVLTLAVKSLKTINDNYHLEISHAGLLSELLASSGIEGDTANKVREIIYNKSTGNISDMLEKGEISSSQAEIVKVLTVNYKDSDALFSVLENYSENPFLLEFKSVCETLKKLDLLKNVTINFSLVNNMSYYSGVVFKGYIDGIPQSVLSGGQYDKLLKKLRKNAGAIGFAVYLDSFERLNLSSDKYDADIVLIVKDETPDEVLKKAEELSSDGKRVLVRKELPKDLKYQKAVFVNGEEC